MELQLKNIGMIKEANVKIDGLTVIAGENDTGKSTVGKALFMFSKVHSEMILAAAEIVSTKNKNDNIDLYYNKNKKDLDELATLPSLIFKTSISGATGTLKVNNKILFDYQIDKNNVVVHKNKVEEIISFHPIFIESPLIWNFTDFFGDIALIETQYRVELDYPYLMKDLNFKLHIKNSSNGLDIKEKVIKIMGGEFKKDKMGHYYFDKQGQRIELVNTATGIKTFGIFQVLSQNNWLSKDTVLILDEPEVHLHPEWQLKMAKIIVELVRNGIKIVVNSHSPYMIDALKYYSDKSKVNSNFYLAEKNEDDISIISNVTMDISPIFEKLTEPLRELRKMKLGLK